MKTIKRVKVSCFLMIMLLCLLCHVLSVKAVSAGKTKVRIISARSLKAHELTLEFSSLSDGKMSYSLEISPHKRFGLTEEFTIPGRHSKVTLRNLPLERGYMRVRAFKKQKGKKVYGPYSAVKSVKIKGGSKYKLNATKFTMNIGDTKKLKVKGYKGKVKWMVYTAAASVDSSGKIKAKYYVKDAQVIAREKKSGRWLAYTTFSIRKPFTVSQVIKSYQNVLGFTDRFDRMDYGLYSGSTGAKFAIAYIDNNDIPDLIYVYKLFSTCYCVFMNGNVWATVKEGEEDGVSMVVDENLEDLEEWQMEIGTLTAMYTIPRTGKLIITTPTGEKLVKNKRSGNYFREAPVLRREGSEYYSYVYLSYSGSFQKTPVSKEEYEKLRQQFLGGKTPQPLALYDDTKENRGRFLR